MFTGIIEKVGLVKSARKTADGLALSIDLAGLEDGTKIGDSISINGVCLTVEKLSGSVAEFKAVPETVSKTNISHIGPNSKVNIERALRVGDRLGGHFVQGHVDGIAKVSKIERQENRMEFHFYAGKELCDQIVTKGSIAINGISLTVVDVASESFYVAIIPHTLSNTTMENLKIGDEVNIEVDILGKWVRKILGSNATKKGLTMEDLRRSGF
jgi:riboflavin synthase